MTTKTTHSVNSRLVIEFLEEKIKEDRGCEREYSLYLDYREDGLKAVKKNKSNLYIWSRLRDEVLDIHNEMFE